MARDLPEVVDGHFNVRHEATAEKKKDNRSHLPEDVGDADPEFVAGDRGQRLK
jgi:hypothetical protein